jgi:ribosomal protein S18 acetylase RimI-like enzyme
MTDICFERWSAEQTLARLEDIADLYIDAHSENPGESDEIFSRPGFIDRTIAQARRDGFEFVVARSGNTLTGFAFGYLVGGSKWWADCSLPPQEVFLASKFAVIELDVGQFYQGRGIGKRLIELLLSGRPEKFATLAATPDSPAQAMYIRWGWYKVGTFETPPVMDAMVFRLHGATPRST